MIDLNEVAVFIRVVDAGSFSGAAKFMGLPRSTVSRKVSRLEESLGVRLLQRSTRKLSLTQPGRDYYLQCSGALSEIDQANRCAANSQQTPSGVIRIAALLASQSGFIGEWINEFLACYPDVSAEIVLSDAGVDMIDAGIDVALRAGALVDSSLVARRLIETRLILCASPKYLANNPAPTSIDDIKQHQCIVVGAPKPNCSWSLDNAQGKVVVPIQAKVIVNSMEYAVNACTAGLGLALLPDAMVNDHFKNHGLQRVMEDYSAERGGLYVVYPSRTHLSITVRAFVEFITEKAENSTHWKARP